MIDDPDVRILLGDAREQLATLDAESVQCIVTSPPFWNLRDYGGGELEIGREATPEAWVENLVDVMRAARRVLRRDGVAWLEVGDTYADRANARTAPSSRALVGHEVPGKANSIGNGRKAKDLVGAPWMLAFALRADGWFLRAEVIWHRPNPMPSSALDRTTVAHSQVFLLSRSSTYFYDADAIREPLREDSVARYSRSSRYDDAEQEAAVPYAATRPRGSKRRTVREGVDTAGGGQGNGEISWELTVGANARSVWSIPTQPTSFEHFATMPEELARRCIAAGSRVGDAILDPFMGSGTTALVARRMGRVAIGVELKPAYLEIARERLSQQSLFA